MHNYLIHRINSQIAEKFLYKGRVIDLGCGTAPYKETILKTADEYIGVDWEISLHDKANVDVIADLSERLPFDDNYADIVVSFQVMEHLPEPHFFLSECFRILKQNGRLLLTVPFMWHIHEEPHDFFRYTRYGLRHLLAKAGFSDIEIHETTGFWQMWVLKFNYHTKRFGPGPIKFCWFPIWWLGQIISPILDRFDKNPEETASYAVFARKP